MAHMSSILIKNATIINEGMIFRGEMLIKDEFISAIKPRGQITVPDKTQIIDAEDCF